MQEFDLIVIGGGSGLEVSSQASSMGLKVAIIEEGPLGGTCLNRGCIPSKLLIHSADIVETISRAHLFGIKPRGYSVDFSKIVRRVTKIIDDDAASIEKAIRNDKNSTLFKTRAKFIGNKTLLVDRKKIHAKKIIIATGTRPSIPPILGLDKIPFITSDQALRLKARPKKLTILGGGYIGAELAHFFNAMGTEVTIIDRGDLLLSNEDKNIAEAFTSIFTKKHRVFLKHKINKVEKSGEKFITYVESANGGKERKIESDQLLVATGRIPNSDILDVKKAGIEVNERGFVKTNEFLETAVPGIWALGDIAGKFLFKHSANLEAEYVTRSALHGKKLAIDYTAMPHAIFTSPQIAGVGEKQQDLDNRKANYAVGIYRYHDTAMGLALEDEDGFVKVYAEKKTGKILGCHIIGTDASTLIHEVVVAMKAHGTVDAITDSVHVHPALSEVVQRAFNSIEW